MAMTEYYVSAAGAGAHDGTSAANALTWAEMITQINSLGAGGGAGRRYNYAGSTSRTTTTDTLTVGGTAASPLVIRGCSSLSSITDGDQGRTSSNGDLVTTNFGVVTYTSGRLALSTFTMIENLSVSASSLNNYVIDVGVNSLAFHCGIAISGTGGGSARCMRLDGAASSAIDCDFNNTCTTAAAAVLIASGGNRLIACRARSTNSPAVVASNLYAMIVDNIIHDSVTGISLTSTSANGMTALIYHNTIYNCSAEGILLPNSAAADDLPVIMNNHIQDCGQSIDSGYAGTADLSVFWAYNRTDNTSADDGFDNWMDATNKGNITTATALEYPGSGDYNLSSGALAIGAGLPKFASMGALQKSASGGGAIGSGNLSGGFQ